MLTVFLYTYLKLYSWQVDECPIVLLGMVLFDYEANP